jgi:hypothetical protein
VIKRERGACVKAAHIDAADGDSRCDQVAAAVVVQVEGGGEPQS